MTFWQFAGIFAVIIIGASVYAVYRDQKAQREEDELTARICDNLDLSIGTGTEAPISAAAIRNEYERDYA